MPLPQTFGEFALSLSLSKQHQNTMATKRKRTIACDICKERKVKCMNSTAFDTSMLTRRQATAKSHVPIVSIVTRNASYPRRNRHVDCMRMEKIHLQRVCPELRLC